MAHSETNDCRNREGTIVWRGGCECGWEGPDRGGPNAARDANRDYRGHVEGALGDMAYYEAPAGCVNCGYRGPVRVLVGTAVYSALCPRCGVSGRLRPDNDVADEDAERRTRSPW